MQFVYALSVLLALATVNAYEYSKEFDSFNIDPVVADNEKLKGLVGCFLDTSPCSPLSEEFKRDMPDAFQTACKNCTDKQKVIMGKFLNGLKSSLPAEYEAFTHKYDHEGKYTPLLHAAVA